MKNHTNDDDLLPILPPMLLRTEAVYNFTYGNFSIIVEKVFTKTPEQINYVNSNDNYYAYQLTHSVFLTFCIIDEQRTMLTGETEEDAL